MVIVVFLSLLDREYIYDLTIGVRYTIVNPSELT